MRMRSWIEVVAAFVCLWAAANVITGVFAFVLIIAAFTLVFDVGSAWLARQSSTGSLSDHRQ